MPESDQFIARLLPVHWETNRLDIADATIAEVPRLHAIFSSCEFVEPWDETFHPVPQEEILELVNQSLADDPAYHYFKLQSLREKETGQIVGYFHLHHGRPQASVCWVSMFVLHKNHQSQGYGREAIGGLARRVRELEYQAIWLRVYLKNWPALRFWVSQDFRSILKVDGDQQYSPAGYASLVLERRLL